ncbi:hypothetical protein ACS0TY_016021 [Phlomoides rotata]
MYWILVEPTENTDVAEVAARHLFKVEPSNIGNYILLCEVYAKAERWEDVLKVRKLIRKKGLRKSPAFSWVEGEKGVVHEFYAGDSTHPRCREIKEVLENLVKVVEKNGYKPNLGSVVYDVSDEEKRRIVMNHSEKLALAYALLFRDDGSAVRIVKNLRICEDCHLFMCGVSGVTGREIIVRDNLRFHHFREGSCSCSNFWLHPYTLSKLELSSHPCIFVGYSTTQKGAFTDFGLSDKLPEPAIDYEFSLEINNLHTQTAPKEKVMTKKSKEIEAPENKKKKHVGEATDEK